MFICKVATEYTLACGEGVPTPNNPQRVDDTMLTTSHIVPSVSMAIQRIRYLYKDGDECTQWTGGWTTDGVGYSSANDGNKMVKRATYIENTGLNNAMIVTQNKVDLTGFTKLCWESTTSATAGQWCFPLVEGKILQPGWAWTANISQHEVKISSLIQKINPANIGVVNDFASKITKIWLEP